MDREFLSKYFQEISKLLKLDEEILRKLIQTKKALVAAKNNSKKSLIFGNGGSSAIASHFSVDLTKNAKIRCVNFNEADLITCFSNDYGYENWVGKAVEFYGDEGDVLILISSSGSSTNILNGCRAARFMNFSKVITLSGMLGTNPLKKMGDINLWVESKAYNHIENIHQFWLLAIVDLIIGKEVYSSNPDAT